MTERRARWLRSGTSVLTLGLVWGFLLHYFRPSLLVLDTMPAGGDTGSFLRPITHLRDTLLPAGNPMGWDLANFAGYPPFQFYPPVPALLIVALSLIVPLNIAFKLVSVAGTFLLPIATATSLRALGYSFPAPVVGAAASLLFLFNEGNSMWGGNIPSTLAGEFSFSLGFALAILFIGLLYRGIESRRGWRWLGLLLALTGLCHPVALLNAALPGLFFLLRRRTFVANLRFLVAVYATAAALMSFWLVPLLARAGYMTSIPWRWDFFSWGEAFPAILLPVFVLAGFPIVWSLVRRSPEDRPALYSLFGAVTGLACFVNAAELGVPDIRFVPVVYMMLVFLAVDYVCRELAPEVRRWLRALPLRYAPHIAGIIVALLCLVWTSQRVGSIPTWIKWNYEGIETKPSYPQLRALMGAVEGSLGDPRVVYEHSPEHDRFGSPRVFENMALLSGRATLEGVLLQNAVTSPFVYWLQSAISQKETRVITGYGYPELDLGRATSRLDLFHVSEMIAVSPEVKSALDDEPRWRRFFDSPPYAVFRREGGHGGYVRVPSLQPVLFESTNWKRDFHRWFGRDEDLEVPLVLASAVPTAERGRFAAHAASLDDLPHLPLATACEITERIDHLEIEFTTTCPGVPHWISVSYSPGWRVEGASAVFLASPAFMMVFPEETRVRLTFGRTAVDWAGLLLTLGGLVGLLVLGPSRLDLRSEPRGVLVSRLTRAHPFLLAATVVGVTAFTSWVAVRDFRPYLLYKRAWRAFNAENYGEAGRDFDLASRLWRSEHRAADAAFFLATSLERTGDHEAANTAYDRVVTDFPDSVWIAESHHRAGVCLRALGRLEEAAERFKLVVDSYPGSDHASSAAEQLRQMQVSMN